MATIANQAWTDPGRSQYIGRPSLSKDITAQAEFAEDSTDDANTETYLARGLFNISISGTFVATVTLQRSFDAGSTWHDVEEYTAATERVVDNANQKAMWRLGVKTGNFTSGTVAVALNQ